MDVWHVFKLKLSFLKGFLFILNILLYQVPGSATYSSVTKLRRLNNRPTIKIKQTNTFRRAVRGSNHRQKALAVPIQICVRGSGPLLRTGRKCRLAEATNKTNARRTGDEHERRNATRPARGKSQGVSAEQQYYQVYWSESSDVGFVEEDALCHCDHLSVEEVVGFYLISCLKVITFFFIIFLFSLLFFFYIHHFFFSFL